MGLDERVWGACRLIPRGKVTTYKELARYVDSSPRAVGGALGRNPHWPTVPCHRVVGSSGHLTGFASGLKRKKQLLEQEGISVRNYRVDLREHMVKLH